MKIQREFTDQSTQKIPDYLKELSLSIESIDLAQSIARKRCRHSNRYLSDGSCEWYHGNWKILRRLDITPQPWWHWEFFSSNMARGVKSGIGGRILICGAADDGMLSLTLAALQDYSNSMCQIVMLDLCPTPVIVSKRLSELLSKQVGFLIADALTLPLVSDSFDMVVTDSLLSRFTGRQLTLVSQLWWRILRPGGLVITTVRLRDDPTSPQLCRSSIRQRVKYSWRAARRSLQYKVNPIRAIRSSWVFSGKVRSHTFSDVEEIRNVMQGYRVSCELSEVKEGVSKRRYALVLAQKADATVSKP